MNRASWIAAVVLLGCGKSEPESESVARQRDEPHGVSSAEIVAAQLARVSAKAGAIAFTIELPAALLKDVETSEAYARWEPKRAWFSTPSFTVQFNDMPLPEEPGTQIVGDDARDRTMVRAEKLPGGGTLTLDQRKDRAFYNLEVCRRVTGGSLCCSVIQRGDSGKALEAFDAVVAMAEKVCRSMKPEN